MENNKFFYYKKSRMSQLRSFCAVVQNECVAAKAAKEINVEPATITKQIQSLENDLDIVLFDRSEHKKLKLTENGDLFYKQAVKHLNGINSLFDNFNKYAKEYSDKHLKIALYETATTYVFPKILGEMLKIEEFKNIEVLIYNISKDEAIKKLINREIDLAFYINDTRDIIPPEIEVEQSIMDKLVLVLNKEHPLAKKDKITKEDIESYKFLEKDINIETKVNNSFNTHFKIIPSNIKVINTDFRITTEIAKYTDNIAIVPELSIRNDIPITKSEIIIKSINNIIPKAFFNVMTLKNYSLKKSTLWVMNKLKSLK